MIPQLYAAGPSAATQVAQGFLQKINDVVVFPLVTLLMAVALLLFLYGGMVFIMNANNPTARDKGRKHMLWGIVGLFIMATAFTILSIAAGTFGLQRQVDCATNPRASGCDTIFLFPSKTGGPTGGNPGGPTSGNPGGPTGGNQGGPTGGNPGP